MLLTLSFITSSIYASQTCGAKHIQTLQRNAPNKLIALKDKAQNNTPGLKPGKPRHYQYKIINQLIHDRNSFTQGLVVYNQHIYESSGILGKSSIQKIDIDTGKIIDKKHLNEYSFAEGLSIHNKQLIQITWKSGRTYTYAPEDLKLLKKGHMDGDGWGITSINNQLLISDGSSTLKWINPATSQKNITVKENGIEIQGLNELEYAEHFIYANIWPSDCIAKIAPNTGEIVGWIDISKLFPEALRPHWTAVANGIAYYNKHLFVTGKYWPYIYELEIKEAI